MTPTRMKELLEEYISRIGRWYPEPYSKGTFGDRLRETCEGLREAIQARQDPGALAFTESFMEVAHRRFGYIQGALWALGIYSYEELHRDVMDGIEAQVASAAQGLLNFGTPHMPPRLEPLEYVKLTVQQDTSQLDAAMAAQAQLDAAVAAQAAADAAFAEQAAQITDAEEQAALVALNAAMREEEAADRKGKDKP